MLSTCLQTAQNSKFNKSLNTDYDVLCSTSHDGLACVRVCVCVEHVEVCGSDAEADQPRQTTRTVEEQLGAGDSELPRGGDQAA